MKGSPVPRLRDPQQGSQPITPATGHHLCITANSASDVSDGSGSVIRRSWLDIRFTRKRTRLGELRDSQFPGWNGYLTVFCNPVPAMPSTSALHQKYTI